MIIRVAAPEAIGAQLHGLRVALGLTVANVAAAVCLSQEQVLAVEHGTAPAPPDMVTKFLRMLGHQTADPSPPDDRPAAAMDWAALRKCPLCQAPTGQACVSRSGRVVGGQVDRRPQELARAHRGRKRRSGR